jgi:putative ABC transport system permease protein
MMGTLWQDIVHGARVFLKAPGMSAIAILTLMFGIGTNVTIFSVVSAALIHTIPAKSPQQLVKVSGAKLLILQGTPTPDLSSWSESSGVFEHVAAYAIGDLNLTGDGNPQRILAAQVSADFFSLLGAKPAFGRTFLSGDDLPGRNQIIVLSYALWRHRYGSDPSILGAQVTINGGQVTVVGVMPDGFEFPSDVKAWVPIGLGSDTIFRGAIFFRTIARLKPGMSVINAQEAVNRATGVQDGEEPNSLKGVRLSFLQDEFTNESRAALLILLGAVALVLLIASSNVANLLLARSVSRRKEFAIRAALGASRLRIFRQLITESTLLAALGGGLGLLLALFGKDALVAISPVDIPNRNNVVIDFWVLGFTVVVSILTVAVFGIAPALQSSRLNLNEVLKGNVTSSITRANRGRLRSMLIISEVAISMVLLVGASLLIKSFIQLQRVDPGLNPDNVLTMSVALPKYQYSTGDQRSLFYSTIIERIEAVPGVQVCGATNDPPLKGEPGIRIGLNIEGLEALDSQEKPFANYRAVSPHYFSALNIPLLRGRFFSDLDRADAPAVVIINQATASRFFPGEDSIGKRVSLGLGTKQIWSEIVGVVGNVRHWGLDAELSPEVYASYMQRPSPFMDLVIRASAAPLRLSTTIRNEILAVSPEQPIAEAKTMNQILSDSYSSRRFTALLMSIFAGLALIFAILGIYSVVAYSITQRTREIGIRLALGAQPGDIIKLLMREMMTLVTIGMGIGLLAALYLTRLLESLLYEITATDLSSFFITSILLIGTTLLASYLPTQRATTYSASVLMRHD